MAPGARARAPARRRRTRPGGGPREFPGNRNDGTKVQLPPRRARNRFSEERDAVARRSEPRPSARGLSAVNTDRLINILAAVTLVELMLTIGLGASVPDVWGVARDWRGVTRALAANYLLVPAAAVGLIVLFRADTMVAAGVLVVAVCPGAPYGPPFTAIAKGDVARAVGLMVILAGSSAILAPVLLQLLLPLIAPGGQVK